MWQTVQNSFYLNTLQKRASDKSNLSWCNQVIELIRNDIALSSHANNLSINDIGCQYLQLYKALQDSSLPIEYFGLDIDQDYKDIAMNNFAELPSDSYKILDISKTVPSPATYSVSSATIEHIDHWTQALSNIFASTIQTVFLRLPLGEYTKRDEYLKYGADQSYPFWQFSFHEIMSVCFSHGFKLNSS